MIRDRLLARWAPLALAAALGGCAVATVKPDAAALQTLPPQDRSALLVDGELLRLAGMDLNHHGILGVVTLQAQAGQPVYTYVGAEAGYREGKLVDEPQAYVDLCRARAASPFHRPVKAQAGAVTLWFVHDLVPVGPGPAGEYRSTLDVFAAEPRADRTSFPYPMAVITLDSRGSGKVPGTPSVKRPEGAVTLESVTMGPDGRLESVTMAPWRPTLPFMIQGKCARDLWNEDDAQTEQVINDALLEWKNLTFPAWLRQATPEQLAQAALETEKGILALDLSIRLLKDKMDAATRAGNEPIPGAGAAEQLMSQRKMLLTVILGAVKATAAQAPAP